MELMMAKMPSSPEPPIKLENIPISEYKLTFKNNFKQLVVKKIKLLEIHNNTLKFLQRFTLQDINKPYAGRVVIILKIYLAIEKNILK